MIIDLRNMLDNFSMSASEELLVSAARTVTLCGRALDKPGHVCAFFDSRAEEYDTLLPYFEEGIALDERVITIVDDSRQQDHVSRLNAGGIDVAAVKDDGRLQVLMAEDTYMKGGRFGAERMYQLLQSALVDAQQSGRACARPG